MAEWIFIIPAFAVWLAYENIGKLRLFVSDRGSADYLVQCLHLIWQTLLLILLYFFAIEIWLPANHEKEALILFLLPAAFALGQHQKESTPFFLTVFFVAYYSIQSKAEEVLINRVFLGIYLSLGVLLFETLLLGVMEKLQLSRIPKGVRGVPLFLIVASLMTIILWGLQTV